MEGLFEGGLKHFIIYGKIHLKLINYFLMLQIQAIGCFSKDI